MVLPEMSAEYYEQLMNSICLYSYVIWYEKGYQEFDKVISTTTTKVKGIAVTNYSQLNVTIPGAVDGIRIWDVADYVMPPQVNYCLHTLARCAN